MVIYSVYSLALPHIPSWTINCLGFFLFLFFSLFRCCKAEHSCGGSWSIFWHSFEGSERRLRYTHYCKRSMFPVMNEIDLIKKSPSFIQILFPKQVQGQQKLSPITLQREVESLAHLPVTQLSAALWDAVYCRMSHVVHLAIGDKVFTLWGHHYTGWSQRSLLEGLVLAIWIHTKPLPMTPPVPTPTRPHLHVLCMSQGR